MIVRDVGGELSVALTGTGGTLDAPEVTLTRGVMMGAAMGTVLAPGVGSGAGAALGGKMGKGFKKLFANDFNAKSPLKTINKSVSSY